MTQPRRDKWTPGALALFAAYAPHREPYRPLACDDGPRCWVRDGPPSIGGGNNRERCVGCAGAPISPLGRQRRVRLPKR